MKKELFSVVLEKDMVGLVPLTLFVTKDEAKLPRELLAVDELVEGRLSHFITHELPVCSAGSIELLYARPGVKEPRVAVVCLAETKKDVTLEAWQQAVGATITFWQTRKTTSLALVLPVFLTKTLTIKDAGVACAKGAVLAAYDFNNYKSDKKAHAPALSRVAIIAETKDKKTLINGLTEGQIIGESINVARQLGDLPPLHMTPAYLGAQATALGKKFKGLKVTVLNKAAMEKLKMGALLGVNMGSSVPPAFIVMEWMKARNKKTAPVVLVGKGITFDSGGISIKPADKMDEMKYDMLGGAAVIGAMRTIAALNLPVNAVGLVPATENMPSGSAYRPGDILTGMGGKTIEVLNTDAEGRIILSDGLEYAKRYAPALTITIATLTGACWRALGEDYAGLFAREEKILNHLKTAAEESGEPVWQLPLNKNHTQQIKSAVADVKNLGGALAGASTAAAFLAEFTSYPWAHLDIAGVMAYDKNKPFQRQGARGYGVHLLTTVVRNWFKV